MKGDFIRINIMLFKNRSNQPEKYSMQNKAKNLEFFIFFKKRFGKDFLLDGSRFVYPCKNAKKRIVMSFFSETLCETVVLFDCQHKRFKNRSDRGLIYLLRAEKCETYLKDDDQVYILRACKSILYCAEMCILYKIVLCT